MVVMGIFATALALILWPEPQMAMLDLDDDQYADFEFKFDAEEMPEEVVEDPKAGNAAVKKLRGGSDSSKKVDKKAKSLQDLKNFKLGSVADIPSGDIAAGSGPEVGGPRGPRGSQAGDITDVAVPTNLGGGSASGGDLFGGGSSSFSGGATISRREAMGVTLQDDNAIIGMVQRVMRAELRKIKTCYTQQLKVDENLQGQWVLMFTVGSDGKTKDISVSAKQKTNADLESCMSTKVTGWQFQPIKADQRSCRCPPRERRCPTPVSHSPGVPSGRPTWHCPLARVLAAGNSRTSPT